MTAMLEPGDRAPAFEGQDHRGESLSLDALRAKGPVVIFFYPKDFTPVCTREACFFQEAYEGLRAQGAEIVGISADTPESHRAFAAQHRLDFPLLSDEDRKIAEAYGILHPFGLGAKRATFVVDAAGVVRGVFHYELRAKKHVEEVEALLDELGARA
jgi:peroxiredoxin Q/BCP